MRLPAIAGDAAAAKSPPAADVEKSSRKFKSLRVSPAGRLPESANAPQYGGAAACGCNLPRLTLLWEVSVRLTAFLLALLAMAAAAAPLSARQCKYRELQSKVDEKVTMTAKIDMVEAEEDDPNAVFITLDNTAADHCFTFLTGVPKAALGACKAGKTVTATGKVYERMDAWWGLQKVTAITCK